MLFLINITKVLLLLSLLFSSIIYQLVNLKKMSDNLVHLCKPLEQIILILNHCELLHVSFCLSLYTSRKVQVYTNYQFYLLL